MELVNIKYNSGTTPTIPSTPRIAVVGAGIAGVTSAYRILHRFSNVHLDVLAAYFPPHTTSDAVAGLWTPYLCKDDPVRIKRWAAETYNHWDDVYRTSNAPLMGICQLSGTCLHTTYQKDPFWSDVVQDYRKLREDEVQRYGSQYCCGEVYTSFTSEAKLLSPFLFTKIVEMGGTLIQRKLNAISELYADYDIVINCTGLAAHFVTPDKTVRPIRGQVMRVRAPWVKTFLMEDDNYIIPNIDSVLLGGTHQEDDWNTQIDSNDSHNIWEGCCRLMPCLKKAPILTEWVGLRPSRSPVRLEVETLKKDGTTAHVIHNYGHGGSGLTLCWGCAGDVTELVHEHFRSKHSCASKL